MGKIQEGILGGFDGKVGTVIGGRWKGIDYMRGKGRSKRTNNSPAQLEQQAKFSVALNFVGSMSDLFNTTYAKFAKRMTAANYAMRSLANESITGVYPNFSIDYSKVLVSRGSLRPELKTDIVLSVAAGILKWQWKFVEDQTGAKGTDKVMLVVYCPFFDHYKSLLLGPDRSTNVATLDLTSFVGQTVETWMAFMSPDKKKFSNSVYTGQMLVA